MANKDKDQQQQPEEPRFYRPKEPASGSRSSTGTQEDPVTGEQIEIEVTEPWVINPHQVFAADHELVVQYPHLFRPLEAGERPFVEQTTARAGEQR